MMLPPTGTGTDGVDVKSEPSRLNSGDGNVKLQNSGSEGHGRQNEAISSLPKKSTKDDVVVVVKVPFPLILPEELTLHIIWSSGDFHMSENLFSDILGLSRVCRDLRSIIVAHQPFWQHLWSRRKNLQWTDIHLARSGALPLFINISDSLYGDTRNEMGNINAWLSVVAHEEHRWQSFSQVMREGLRSTVTDHHRLAFQGAVSLNVGNRSLPQLETLRAAFGKDAHNCPFQSWNVPKLRTLEVINVVPAFIHPLKVLRKLSFGCHELLDFSDVVAFRRFMAVTPSIEELSLSFVDVDLLLPEHAHLHSLLHDFSQPLTVSLNITTLNIVVQDSLPQSFVPVLGLFEMPKLAHLTVFLEVMHRPRQYGTSLVLNTDSTFSSLINVNPAFMNVSTLCLDVRGLYSFVGTSISLPSIDKFRSLRYLKLKSSSKIALLHPTSDSTSHTPVLNTIHLTDCPDLSISWLKALRERLEALGAWETLNALIIEGCPQLNEKNLIAGQIIPKDKLQWSAESRPIKLLVDNHEVASISDVNSESESWNMYMKGLYYHNHRGEPFLCGLWSGTQGHEGPIIRLRRRL